MTITCLHSETIQLADPAAILDTDISFGKVADVPTVILRADPLLQQVDAVSSAVSAILDKEGAHAQKSMGFLERALYRLAPSMTGFGRAAHYMTNGVARAHERAVFELETTGFVSPISYCGAHPFYMDYAHNGDKDSYRKRIAAVVVLPQESLSFGSLVAAGSFVTHEDTASLVDKRTLHYAIACHEFGHVAGADEAQADKIAALFTRRAFGPVPYPRVIADLRALRATLITLSRIEKGLDADISHSWNMVSASDDVDAMPQAKIGNMSDSEIFDTAFEKVENHGPRVISLAHLFAKAMRTENVPHAMPRQLQDIDRAAQSLKNSVSGETDDADIHRMAARLALATRRLSIGAAAYEGPGR